MTRSEIALVDSGAYNDWGGGAFIDTLEIEVPDQVAEALKRLVERAWFASEAETGRFALAELVHHHRLDLQEPFPRDDIVWALSVEKADG